MIAYDPQVSPASAAQFSGLRERLMKGLMNADELDRRPVVPAKARRPVSLKKREQILRAAVGPLTHLAAASPPGLEEAEVLRAAYAALCAQAGISPGAHPQVALRLEQQGLLEHASVAHVEYRRCSIDYAWPKKRVGLRVHSWPDGRTPANRLREIDDTDVFLRQQGWLVFPVYLSSNTFDEQVDRAIWAVKRIGTYPRRTT